MYKKTNSATFKQCKALGWKFAAIENKMDWSYASQIKAVLYREAKKGNFTKNDASYLFDLKKLPRKYQTLIEEYKPNYKESSKFTIRYRKRYDSYYIRYFDEEGKRREKKVFGVNSLKEAEKKAKEIFDEGIYYEATSKSILNRVCFEKNINVGSEQLNCKIISKKDSPNFFIKIDLRKNKNKICYENFFIFSSHTDEISEAKKFLYETLDEFPKKSEWKKYEDEKNLEKKDLDKLLGRELDHKKNIIKGIVESIERPSELFKYREKEFLRLKAENRPMHEIINYLGISKNTKDEMVRRIKLKQINIPNDNSKAIFEGEDYLIKANQIEKYLDQNLSITKISKLMAIRVETVRGLVYKYLRPA